MLAGVIACYVKVPGQNQHYSSFRDRTRRLFFIPLTMCLSSGTFIYDSVAMFEGLLSNDSTFLRTPKAGNKKPNFNVFDTSESVSSMDSNTSNQDHQQRRRIFKEISYFGVGIFFAVYLGIIPFLDLFIWDWSTKTLGENLTPLGLIIPAVGVATYHSCVFYELYASLNDSPPLNMERRKNHHFMRKITLLMAAINSYSIFTITFASVGTLKELRLSEHLDDQSHLSPITSHALFEQMDSTDDRKKWHKSERQKDALPGYCNW